MPRVSETRRHSFAAWSLALLLSASTGSPAGAQESRPQSAVATIDGHAVTRNELVRHLLDANRATVTQILMLEAVLDLELKRTGAALADEDIRAERERLLAAARTESRPSQLREPDGLSEGDLWRQARISAGWNKLQEQDATDSRETPGNWHDTAEIRRQLFIRRRLDAYDVASDGADPPPPAGLLIEVREKEGAESRRATRDEAAAFLLGLVRPEALRAAVDDLVDALLVDRETMRSGKPVTAEEVDEWAASMRKKYPPPFDWGMICRFKGTTTDRERERWRRVEAWKRATGWKLEEKALQAFIAKNHDWIAGKHQQDRTPVAERAAADPSFREWIVDELQTREMKDWLAGLRAKSRIWVAPDSELAKLLR